MNWATGRYEAYRFMKIVTQTRDVIEFQRYPARGNVPQFVIFK